MNRDEDYKTRTILYKAIEIPLSDGLRYPAFVLSFMVKAEMFVRFVAIYTII